MAMESLMLERDKLLEFAKAHRDSADSGIWFYLYSLESLVKPLIAK